MSDSACSTVVCAVCTTDRSKDSKAEKTDGIAIDKTRKKIPSPIELLMRIVYENYEPWLIQTKNERDLKAWFVAPNNLRFPSHLPIVSARKTCESSLKTLGAELLDCLNNVRRFEDKRA